MMNKEEYLEYQRRYREEHREEIRAKDRVRYQNNKEYQREYQKNYRLKNKEKIKEYQKEYHKRSYSYVSVRGKEEPIQTDLFEIWKDINEDYCVSNYGKVWSRKRNRLVGHKNGVGYIEITIDGKARLVHRLVAEAFIPNPDNYPEIDHIDTDKSNNVWTNLRWTDRKGNQNNPITKERMKVSNKRKTYNACHEAARKKQSKRVFQYTTDGVFIREYNSAKEAAKEMGVDKTSISECCRGVTKTSKGFVWKYADAA